MSILEQVLSRLEEVRQTSNGWSACCPAHHDETPSLSIALGDKAIILHCFAGCSFKAIAAAVGIREADFFYEQQAMVGRRCAKPNLKNIAGRFRNHAAALRLRADNVLSRACNIDVQTWSDDELNQAMRFVHSAYLDIERAELLEDTAQRLLVRAKTKKEAYESGNRAA